jgi:UDP-N-acetylmuramoylalanine--D-glutamate ligase
MKNILIYGRGKVGLSLEKFCQKIVQPYTICDDSDAPADLEQFDSIIPSPGISSSHPVYDTGKIVSELDFLFSFVPKGFQIHAVTGTDGKSTTSWILYHFLRDGFNDVPVYLGGNFGTPFADIVSEIMDREEKSGHIVLEVSSFMAYHLEKFAITSSILTNLHPDHLDWHRDINEYVNAKLNLLGHTKNIILYPESALQLAPTIANFPLESIQMSNDITVNDGLMEMSKGVFMDISDRQLYGNHNLRNIFFAASLAMSLGLTPKTLSSILPNVSALPHRLQKVSGHDGKIWIDDSKSTTAQSLFAALSAFSPQKVSLIAGGKDKGDSFTSLSDMLKYHCTQCVTLGETKQIFLQAAHDAYIPVVAVSDMQEAVAYMSEHTVEGDIILLSPGCASLDMFRSYEDRAEQFAAAIEGLGHASE